MTHLRAIPIAVAAALLAGCGMTEDYVRTQVQQSEARLGARLDQVEADGRSRDDQRESRDQQRAQAVAGELARLRAQVAAEGEARRRMMVEALARQREAVAAELRSLDEALATLGAPPGALPGPPGR